MDHSDEIRKAADCARCNGERWVCEDHADVPFEGGNKTCCGGAGMPCTCSELYKNNIHYKLGFKHGYALAIKRLRGEEAEAVFGTHYKTEDIVKYIADWLEKEGK